MLDSLRVNYMKSVLQAKWRQMHKQKFIYFAELHDHLDRVCISTAIISVKFMTLVLNE